jgi:hypothetical protein
MNISFNQNGTYSVIRIGDNGSRELFMDQIVNFIRKKMVEGNRHFAISFSTNNLDENRRLSILKECSQLISHYEGLLAFVESDHRITPFFRFMCEIFDIRFCQSEEELEEVATPAG